MNFTLNILDNNGAPLDVGNLVVGSKLISLTNGSGDTIGSLDLKAGNDYNLVFPADASAPTATVNVSFPEDGLLDFTTVAGQLASGLTVPLTPNADITTINFSVLSAAETYDATVTITGEDITITIDGNVTTGANIATETLTDNDTVDITVESPGYFTYTNTVRVYQYDLDVSVKLIQNITDPNDPEYRRPYPWFFEILEPCSFNVHTYNAQSAPFGMISYQESGEEYATGGNAILDTCQPDIVSITQRIVVRAIANCGGTSPIIWDETYTIDGIETTEYRPSVLLERPFDCCEVIDTEITLNPQEILLHDSGIHSTCDINTIDPSLVYTITEPDGTETILASYSGTLVAAAILAADFSTVGFTYTPTVLGTYSLSVSITNCCTTIEQISSFDVCNSWAVTNTECNIIEITNYSLTQDLTFTLRELSNLETFTVVDIDDVPQSGIVVPSGTTTSLDLQVDNLYTVDITDNLPSTTDKEYIFLLDCNIKKCKKQLLLNYLCDGGEVCDEITRAKLADDWLRFSSFEAIVYQKWDVWKQQQTIFDTLSINDIMEDVITLGKAMDVMQTICNKCGIKNDCSCEKRYTCNYTITNFGYLVPTRYATIIVPKNGTDCGCN